MIDSRIYLSVLFLFSACGSNARDGGGDDDDVGVDAAPRCQDGSSTSTIMVGAGSNGVQSWTLDAVVDRDAVIAHHVETDGAMRVAWIAGATATDVSILPGAGAYRFTAAAVGKCAAFVSSKAGLYYGCAGTPAAAAGLAHLDADHPLVPFEHADGTLSIFMQSFAAFTEVVRDASGAWGEIEKFESSISYPTDVVSASEQPIVCFISSGNRAVLELGDSHVASTVTARTCKLAVDGSMVHVITDAGYAQVPIASIVGAGGTFTPTPVTALTNQTIVSLFVDDGALYALARTADNKVVVTHLPDGTPMEVGTITTSQTLVQWDAALQAVHIVSSKLDTSGAGPTYPQTITNETHCLP